MVRDGLRSLIRLQADFELAGEASNGEAAVAMAGLLKPQVIVMDMSMPELNGVEATQRIKREQPNVKILALTVHDDPSYVRRFINAGASGYVLKRAGGAELAAAIRAVAAGESYLDPGLTSEVIANLFRQPNVPTDGQVDALSEREATVIRNVARGLTNKEIAAKLDISVKSIETYKARAMEKLSLRSRAELVRFAADRNWLIDA
ncbi:MAG: response regulator transcription factor [Planctomycetaceae bacterium]|nr:response regulator transcription factor [Planctomycetaceae bacterium]